MYNWSTDETKFKTPEAKKKWELEQMINYGLGNKKLDKADLELYLSDLDIDNNRRKFLNFLIHG